MTTDPVGKLEHEHLHLGRVVDSVREAVRASLRGERDTAEVREVLDEFLRLAHDELYAHFDMEETRLFPYLVERFPDCRPIVEGLSVAHDRMCGVLSRLERVVSLSPEQFAAQFDSVIALFARFDANYEAHANDERNLLRDLSVRLSADQREDVADMLND